MHCEHASSDPRKRSLILVKSHSSELPIPTLTLRLSVTPSSPSFFFYYNLETISGNIARNHINEPIKMSA